MLFYDVLMSSEVIYCRVSLERHLEFCVPTRKKEAFLFTKIISDETHYNLYNLYQLCTIECRGTHDTLPLESLIFGFNAVS
jgi:hypothetical protein